MTVMISSSLILREVKLVIVGEGWESFEMTDLIKNPELRLSLYSI